MKNLKIIFGLVLITLFFSLSSCRREYSKLKTSTRRVSSEFNFLGRNTKSLTSKVDNGKNGGKADSTKLDLAPIKQKNILNDYEYLYTALNLNMNNTIPENIKWDSSKNSYFVVDSNARSLNPVVEVFGWHPYWMGDLWKSYPFKLLSTISFYSYNIDPATGSYQNPEQINMWRTIALVDSAHAKKCRVLLSVACHGIEQNEVFLKNEAAWSTLIDTVAVLIKEKNADGIELNFEDIPFDQKRTFIRFVEFFRNNLDVKLNSKKSFIAISLPPDNSNGFFDVMELQKQVDLCVIKGYDYPSSDASNGAVAPLLSDQEDGLSLDKTLNSYIEQGIETNKTILALPLYGAQWKGTWNPDGFIETTFDKKVTYREIKFLYNQNDTTYKLEPTLDVNSMTNYYFMEFPDSTTVECWFDDDYTLNKKMDLALSKKLKGVGLWALGYDQGHQVFWKLLSDKFTNDTLLISDPVAAINGYPIRVADFFLKYSDLIFTAATLFAITMVVALFIAFSDWRVRTSIFSQRFYYYIFITACTILIIPLLGLLDFFGDMRWKLTIAFLIGIFTGYIILRMTFAFNFKKP